MPGFRYVYIHIGNEPRDTDGCILVASSLNRKSPDFISTSRGAFKDLYVDAADVLDSGERLFINIKNDLD